MQFQPTASFVGTLTTQKSKFWDEKWIYCGRSPSSSINSGIFTYHTLVLSSSTVQMAPKMSFASSCLMFSRRKTCCEDLFSICDFGGIRILWAASIRHLMWKTLCSSLSRKSRDAKSARFKGLADKDRITWWMPPAEFSSGLTSRPCLHRPTGYSWTLLPYDFSGIAPAYCAVPPRLALSQLEGCGGRGIAAQAVLWSVSRSRGYGIESLANRRFQGVFAEKGARFRGKWGLGPDPPPTPGPSPPPPFSWGTVGVLLKIPEGGGVLPGEGRGGARGVYGEFVFFGGGGGGEGAEPHLPRKRAPFSAKTPFSWAIKKGVLPH